MLFRWCVFTLGLTTDGKIAGIITGWDKLAHLVAFMVESWLFVRMFAARSFEFCLGRPLFDLDTGTTVAQRSFVVNKYTLGLIVCSVGAAIGSEFLQKLLSSGRRSFDPMDMVCNAVGSVAGIAFAYYQER